MLTMETLYVTIGYMTDINLIFQLSNNAALFGWILLLFFPHRRITQLAVHSGFLSGALSLLYFGLIAANFQPADVSQFSSLAGISALFQNPNILLAGWVHYLAFDLWVGSWVVRRGKEIDIHQIILVPVLLLTFLLGPIGFLSFLLLSKGKQKWLA
jgi:hypothetical protein